MNNNRILPINVLSLIVKYLYYNNYYACALVNKQFNKVVTPLLWRTMPDEDRFHKAMAGLLASQHQSLGKHVRNLQLDFHICDATFLQLIKHLPLLEVVDLDGVGDVTDASLKRLPRLCPNLTSLSLRKSSISRLSLLALGKYCHRLSSINFDRCFGLPATTFGLLAACPLEFIWIDMEFMDGMENRRKANQAALALSKFDRLTQLTLKSASFYFWQALGISSRRRLSAAAPGGSTWSSLSSLSITAMEPSDVADEPIVTILRSSPPKLTEIELENTTLTDATLNAMVTFLPNVTNVTMDRSKRLTSRGVRQLVRGCPLLKYVSLTGSCIKFEKFPEADDKCLDTFGASEYEDDYYDIDTYLTHLDADAIDKIRAGPDLADEHDSVDSGDSGEESKFGYVDDYSFW